MFRSIVARALVAVSLSAAAAPGCGPATPESNPELLDAGVLEDLGQVYLSVISVTKKPPTSLAQLAARRDQFPGGYDAVKSGRVVVYWGVTPTPDSPSDEVLAYVSDVPEKGGAVLFKDMTIKPMTADAFKAAPRPPGPTSEASKEKPKEKG